MGRARGESVDSRPGARLTATRDAPLGGQAVLEGVMMRGVGTWAVAVRKPTAEQLSEGELDAEEGAKGEIEKWAGYDYVIVNDDFDRAFADLAHIYRAERARRARNPWLHGFVAELLKE